MRYRKSLKGKNSRRLFTRNAGKHGKNWRTKNPLKRGGYRL